MIEQKKEESYEEEEEEEEEETLEFKDHVKTNSTTQKSMIFKLQYKK